MFSLQEYIHKFLWKLTEKYPNRTRIIQVDGDKYLKRFYITPRRLDENGEKTGKYVGYGIYLHYFYRGDNDRELHNHPWEKSLSFILCGGYNEERKDNVANKIITRKIKPFTFNFIKNTDFHRVTLMPNTKHVWTLFFSGKRVQDWGFLDPETNQYIKHEDFVGKNDRGYKKF
jgi:hypothetical protein